LQFGRSCVAQKRSRSCPLRGIGIEMLRWLLAIGYRFCCTAVEVRSWPIGADLCAAASRQLSEVHRPSVVWPFITDHPNPDVGPSNAVAPTRQNLCAAVLACLARLPRTHPRWFR